METATLPVDLLPRAAELPRETPAPARHPVTIRLCVPRAQAAKEINNQIKIGEAIASQRIRDRWSLDQARAEKQEWVQRTHDLLTRLFNSPVVAERCNDWVARLLPEYAPLEDFIELFEVEMRHRLGRLQSVVKRLRDVPDVNQQTLAMQRQEARANEPAAQPEAAAEPPPTPEAAAATEDAAPAPEASAAPEAAPAQEAVPAPEASATPQPAPVAQAAPEPEPTPAPEATAAPQEPHTPETSAVPATSSMPEASPAPEVFSAPVVSSAAEASPVSSCAVYATSDLEYVPPVFVMSLQSASMPCVLPVDSPASPAPAAPEEASVDVPVEAPADVPVEPPVAEQVEVQADVEPDMPAEARPASPAPAAPVATQPAFVIRSSAVRTPWTLGDFDPML